MTPSSPCSPSRKGAIAGINVEQLLKRLERSPLSGGGELRSGRTPYDLLAVNLRITQGTVNVEDVRIEGPTVRLGLAGSASIPARDLDLSGTASLISSTASSTTISAPPTTCSRRSARWTPIARSPACATC